MQLGKGKKPTSDIVLFFFFCWLDFAVVSIVVLGGNCLPLIYLRTDTTINNMGWEMVEPGGGY